MAPKKAKAPAVERNFSVGDIVLVKIKGYPSWPAHVIPHEDAPAKVMKERPPKSQYLVQFFPTGDYSWPALRDITPLSTREIDAYLSEPSKKNGELKVAYEVARDPGEWKESQKLIAEARAQMEAENDTEDQLASDGEATTGQKRKRKSEGGAKKATKSKKAKVESSVKADSEGPKKASAFNPDDAPGMKQVKDWRHKLQKAFLPKDNVINKDDMSKCNDYFNAMEKFEMEKDWLTTSKLAKVLKRIALLENIPLDDQYHFKDRSAALATKWNTQFGTDGGADETTGTASAAEPAATLSTSNGTTLPLEPKAETKADEEPSFAPPAAAPSTTTEPVKTEFAAAPPAPAAEVAPSTTTVDTNGVAPMETEQPALTVDEIVAKPVETFAAAPVAPPSEQTTAPPVETAPAFATAPAPSETTQTSTEPVVPPPAPFP